MGVVVLMATTGSGGARRVPVAQETERIHSVLQDYCLTEPVPFDLGGYNVLRSSQAASGLGLVCASGFLSKWTSAFPSGQIQATKFIQSLDMIITNGAMSRFLPSHTVWDGLNVQNAKMRKLWCEKAYSRAMVALNHLRRIHLNVTKKQQALRGLPQSSIDLIENILAKMPVPEKTDGPFLKSDSSRSLISATEGVQESSLLIRPPQGIHPQ